MQLYLYIIMMLDFTPLVYSFPSSHVGFYSTSSITGANEEPMTTKRNYVDYSNLFVRSTKHKQISAQRCAQSTHARAASFSSL